MVDWIAVLRNIDTELGLMQSPNARVVQFAARAAADELERQRDATQGNGEEGRDGGVQREDRHVPSVSTAAAADRSAPPPASSARDEIATLLWDHVAVMPGRYGWLNAADAVLAMEAGWRKEIESLRAQLAEAKAAAACDACAGTGKPVSGGLCMCGGTGLASDAVAHLRAQLAEREAELEELIWALKRMGWYASDRADGTAEQRLASAGKCAADFLAAHERARRAKEKP